MIAVIFGEFGVLKLHSEVPLFTFISNSRWWWLTLSYIFLGALGLLFGLCVLKPLKKYNLKNMFMYEQLYFLED
jgi:hypothetical protein